MAKSAKDKLAVDGTPKLAAKSKSSDKHEKKNLSIEEATVESPRQSRKRAGDFFDFGDDADRVADELAGDSPKTVAKANPSKASKPSKKVKIDATETSAKQHGKKAKPSKDESLEDRVVAENAKKSKNKKTEKGDSEVIVGPSGDTVAVSGVSSGIADKAKKGKAKKSDKVTEVTGETTKAKGKKTDAAEEVAAKKKGKTANSAKKTGDDGETIGKRVVAEDAKKHKSKHSDDVKNDVVVGPSGDTAAVADAVPKTANRAKKGKTANDDVAAKSPADGAKSSKQPKKTSSKDKPESSQANQDAVHPVKSKETAKKADSREKPTKVKATAESISSDSKATTKKRKVHASTGDAAEAPKPISTGDVVKKGKPSVGDGKAPKASKAKPDAKKPTKEATAGNSAKQDKGADVPKPKKSTKVKDNKPDIPDQAIQPMDLVQEEAKLSEVSKAEHAKGKKRKAPSDVAADAVKSSLLDPLSEHAADESAKKKQKKSRKSLGETLGDIVATGADAVRNSFTGMLGGGGADGKPTNTGSSNKQSNGKGKATDAHDPQPTANEGDDEDLEGDDAPDDQTAALLAGFESDGDNVHPQGDEGFKEGSTIPTLPNSSAISKKLKAIKATKTDQPGVVYVGRIPHGFYEHEMRTYFNQFGDVKRLRLSRSVKTGRSKHYAFLEFRNEDVAKIVAETMDNYLMFGHILKCKTVAPGNVHESMWKGADKRFKKVPWNKIDGRKLEMPVGRDVWKMREEKQTKKRAEKSKKMLDQVGYAFESTGLKSVDSLPKKAISATTEQEKSLVTAGGDEEAGLVVISEQVTSVKTKKGVKAVAEVVK